MAGMMEVSSKPKQIKQMLLLLSKGKQTVANQADNENENENVNVNGNGNENGKTPSSSSVHGQQLLLNKPPDGGLPLPPGEWMRKTTGTEADHSTARSFFNGLFTKRTAPRRLRLTLENPVLMRPSGPGKGKGPVFAKGGKCRFCRSASGKNSKCRICRGRFGKTGC